MVLKNFLMVVGLLSAIGIKMTYTFLYPREQFPDWLFWGLMWVCGVSFYGIFRLGHRYFQLSFKLYQHALSLLLLIPIVIVMWRLYLLYACNCPYQGGIAYVILVMFGGLIFAVQVKKVTAQDLQKISKQSPL